MSQTSITKETTETYFFCLQLKYVLNKSTKRRGHYNGSINKVEAY